MSSSSPTRPERRRARALALLTAVILAQFPGPAAAGPVPLPVPAVLVHGAETSLVVDLSAVAGTRPGRPAVTRDGVAQRARLVPVMSAGLTVALVVDASAAGAATLPAWLSAAARFVLETPSATRSVVIADAAPAAVTAGPARGPADLVRALTAVRPHGERDTAAALRLALRQFPTAAAGRRVVVLYTTGPDAGGESARSLAARFRAGGTILVVVGTAGGPYWADAAAGTGGFFAPAGEPVVIPALDQVSSTLAGRYLVQFPTPPDLPAQVSVRIDAGGLTLTGEATVARTPPPGAGLPAGRDRTRMWAAVVLVLSVAGAVAAVSVAVWRSRRRSAPMRGNRPAVVARGRAPVPGAMIPPGERPPPP
jgi:VWA domain-containing protein